jgi:hypothetical protein
LSPVLVGGAGVSVGTTPNGLIPSGLRPLWSSVVRRKALLVAIIAIVVLVWLLRLAGVLNNWTVTAILVAVALCASSIPYALDYRRGDAPSAFGLPARRPTGPEHDDASLAPFSGHPAPWNGVVSSPVGTGSHGT